VGDSQGSKIARKNPVKQAGLPRRSVEIHLETEGWSDKDVSFQACIYTIHMLRNPASGAGHLYGGSIFQSRAVIGLCGVSHQWPSRAYARPCSQRCEPVDISTICQEPQAYSKCRTESNQRKRQTLIMELDPFCRCDS
jgi:hypothetical protein